MVTTWEAAAVTCGRDAYRDGADALSSYSATTDPAS
jgi:hypothetical protein